ncbi:cation/calcium exchanger 4-like [Silene latifolia]|uniref:cation/calcium exchanger 4-like n=1 Tax=Silene latifolia TaxID=37657 RepID=UPI003D78315A
MRNPKLRVLFSVISAIVLVTLLYYSSVSSKWSMIHEKGLKYGWVMQEFVDPSLNVNNTKDIKLKDLQICDEFFDHKGYKSSCDFLIANPDCTSGGFFNYIKFFYCDCQNYTFLGYLVLGSWLAVLFYLLGNTASDYFCCSLENLSTLLKMSPTIAGVTLLPLGNGASDVFASIAAFMGTGSGDVGLNGVLGGAVFITCIVVGVVSLSVADKRVQIDKKCFIRDLAFLLITILGLTIMMIIGKVTIWGAIAFLSIYVVYAVYITVNEIQREKGTGFKSASVAPLLPVVESESINASLLSPDSHGDPHDHFHKKGHWIWDSNFAFYSDYIKATPEDCHTTVWGWSNEEQQSAISFSNLCWLLEIPLNIPRRLTIPTIDECRWSKMYAIASTFLAPVLLAFLWNTRENIDPLSGKIAYFIGFGTGFVLSILASLYTKTEHPPRKYLFPWIFGGFMMSMIWFYILADELVSLLVSLGTILGINPSMLALTVLAWGNSMNDLMSNTAFAMNEGNGVQIAMSGCYAGPMFNTLIGLGVSLVLGTWSMGSEPYVIPRDAGLFVTVAFLTAGVVWALVVLPRSDMRPNKLLGVGLIIIYVLFLSIRISMAIGIGSLSSLGIGSL